MVEEIAVLPDAQSRSRSITGPAIAAERFVLSVPGATKIMSEWGIPPEEHRLSVQPSPEARGSH
jgi:hypothetical protein